ERIGIGDERRIEGIERQRAVAPRRRGHVVHASSYHEASCRANERPPSIADMFALTQGLRRAVQIKPNGPSTAFASRRRTWQQTLDRVTRVAGALSALGVNRGDRVGILALNSDRYFELMYAIPWIGAAVVPINTRLAAPEIEYVLADSGTVALFI